MRFNHISEMQVLPCDSCAKRGNRYILTVRLSVTYDFNKTDLVLP